MLVSKGNKGFQATFHENRCFGKLGNQLPRRWLPRKPMFLDGTKKGGTRTGTHGKRHFRLRTWCMGKPSKKYQQKYPHLPMANGLNLPLSFQSVAAGGVHRIARGAHTTYLWALRCWRWPNKIDGMSRHTLSRESVFNAMLSLHQKGIAVTRESLQQVTGEPLNRIREHIDSLIESGRVERLHRGVYRPMIEHDNRPVSVTAMPDGSAKIEVGDNLLMLSPVESGCLGQLLQGFMVAVRRA